MAPRNSVTPWKRWLSTQNCHRYTRIYDLNALARSAAATAASTVDSALVMHYSHPLRANDEENALASTDHRIDWLRSFSPGNMPDAVFDQADWHFVPVGGWSEVSGTGPHIRIGRVPINFHAAVATNVQFLQLLGQISKGRLASQQQDWEAARRHLSAVLEAPYFLEELLTPSVRYDVYYKLGLADFALGDHGAALRDWRSAAKLNPQLVEPHYNMGLAFDALGRYAEAVPRYEQANSLQPDNGDILYGLAQSRARLGNYSAAIDAYRQALRLAPTADGYVDLGSVLQANGRLKEARAAFKQALHLAQEHVSAADIRRLLQR